MPSGDQFGSREAFMVPGLENGMLAEKPLSIRTSAVQDHERKDPRIIDG